MVNSPQTTSLSQLLGNNQLGNDQPMQNPTGQFGSNPQMGGGEPGDHKPVTTAVPSGVSQGLSAPEGPSRKEFFGMVDFDWKSVVLVFAIVLMMSSGLFSSCVRPYVPGSVSSDGRVSLIGSLVAAIVGAVLFAVIKFFGKF